MLWLMLYQTYIVLTGSLAFRCAIGAATAAQCHASGNTLSLSSIASDLPAVTRN